MIVNPYQEVISLHDMNIENIEIEDNNAYVRLNNAYLLSQTDNFMLDNPLIIIRDLVDIESNKDYPLRIRVYDQDEIISVNLSDFNEFSFNILEEAYGFGLVHFFGIATKYIEDEPHSFDCFIDIHFCGDLEIKWDDKILLEA